MPTTQLNYDIVPDKSPLYTTVDQLNQSTADLTVTATNAGAAPVTIKVIEIELKKVVQGVDTVQLLLPGSEGGIECPPSLTGPGGSNWSIAKDDGKFTLKPTPDGSTVTFQPQDTLSLTLQNVVIREGGTGTAFVRVIEESDAVKGDTEVGIGITQSTLDVQLSVPPDQTLIEPGQPVTLIWTTTDANSGVLKLPGNTPETIVLDSSNLASGQHSVTPIEDTTYSLTCEGRGPEVMRQVTVSLQEVQIPNFSSSASQFDATDIIQLSWQTEYATSCAISTQEGEGSVNVPLLNGQTTSCTVAATADGTTLIFTTANGTNQELGRITLPVPSPPSVTFELTANGSPMPKQKTYNVDLLQVEIKTWAAEPDGQEQWNGTAMVMVYQIWGEWEVSHAGSVLVSCNGNQVSTSPGGNFALVDLPSPPSATITCQGFGGPISRSSPPWKID